VQAFTLDLLREEQAKQAKRYLEFLRVPSMSLGLYVLPKGGTDPQRPHQEDEVYLVLKGRALLRVGEEDVPAVPGALLYVPARAEHRFHAIEEDLEVLVLFAPAESSPSPQ